MNFFINCAKLTGTPGKAGWTQSYEFTPQDKEKLETRGSLYAIVTTSDFKEGVEGVVAGREMIHKLQEEFYKDQEKTAFNALKDAVEKVVEGSGALQGGTAVAAVSSLGDVVYSAAAGGTKVLLHRGGMLAEILESKTKGGVVSASGYPKEDDILILVTSKFFEKVSRGSLNAALSGKELEGAVELLAPTIRGGEKAGEMGVVFLKFSKEREEIKKIGEEESKKLKKKEHRLDEKESKIKFLPGTFFKRLLQRIPERKIYIRRGEKEVGDSKEKKMPLSISAILLVLLIVSIVFGIRQKIIGEERENYEMRLASAEHEFNEAVEIFSLNPERARELFSESRKKTDALKEEGIEDQQLIDLINRISEGQEQILGEYKLGSELFLDLSLLSDGFSGEKLTVSDETLYILDEDGEKVVKIEIGNKKSEVVVGPSSVDNPEDFTVYSNRVFILNSEGIDEVGEEEKRVVDRNWEGEVLIYSYAGNLYLLEKGINKIWRFAGSVSGFSSKSDWLTPDQNLDFTGVISWTIDGSLWLLYDDGDIDRLSLGNLVSFSTNGVFPPITNPKTIYTNEILGYFYILDPENERVVVLSKEGEYKAQYINGEIRNAIDFGVSEESKRIIILTGEKLLSLELRHI